MRDWQERGEVLDSDEDNEDSIRSWPLQRLSPNKSTQPRVREPGSLQKTTRWTGKENFVPSSDTEDEDENVAAFKRALIARRAKDNVPARPQTVSSSDSQQRGRTAVRSSEDSQDGATRSNTSPASPTNPDKIDHTSSTRTSSPLSELSTHTPEFSQLDFQRLVAGRLDSAATGPESALDAEHRQLLSELKAAASNDGPARRNLRERTTRQLHPFLEERVRYLELCRSRGIRPVRIIDTGVRQQNVEVQEDESQSISSQSIGSQVQDSYQSIPGSSQASQLDFAAREASDASTHISNAQSLQDQTKRRKLAHPVNTDGRLKRPWQTRPTEQHSLPSPSPSLSSAEHIVARVSAKEPARFRYPPGMTPAVSLPTPNVSSETRPIVDLTEDQARSMSPSLSHRHAAGPLLPEFGSETDSDVESVTSIQPAEESQDTRLVHERKRIRGVLPASWLRLDMRHQGSGFTKTYKKPTTSASRTAGGAPQAETSPLKGLARRRTGPRAAEVSSYIDIDPASGSDSDDRQQTARLIQQRLDFERTTDLLGRKDFSDVDDMEHDWVDPLGFTTATKSVDRPRKQRQPRIREAFQTATTGQSRETTSRQLIQDSDGRPAKRRRTTSHKQRLRQIRLPRLSILDVSERDTDRGLKPQFVRIARRRAAQRPNRARQSPSRKYVQLHTATDTHDAMQTLRAWREGTLASLSEQAVAAPTVRPVEHLVQAVSQAADAAPPVKLHSRPAEHRRVIQVASPTVAAPRRGISSAHIRPRKPQRLPTTRSGQLETEVQREVALTRADLFAQRLRAMTADLQVISTLQQVQSSSHDTSTIVRPLTRARPSHGGEIIVPEQAVTHPAHRHVAPRARKRPARRFIIEHNDEPQQHATLAHPDNEDHTPILIDSSDGQASLSGLQPLHQPYQVDFGARRLPSGPHFASDTFVGSGDFRRALTLNDRSLSSAAGRINVHVNNLVFEWSAWTEEVRSQMTTVSDTISAILDSSSQHTSTAGAHSLDSAARVCIDYLLRSMIRYNTHCLHFHEDIDRRDCVLALGNFVSGLMQHSSSIVRTMFLTWLSVLAAQAVKIADHSSVPGETQSKARDLAERVCQDLLTTILDCQLPYLRESLHERVETHAPDNIKDDCTPLGNLVILHWTLRANSLTSFWQIFHRVVPTASYSSKDLSKHEQVWQAMFAVLPALTLDREGKSSILASVDYQAADWVVAQQLLRTVLHAYDATSRVPGATINQYMRTLLHRGNELITHWQWHKCESWLATWFDFFAKRGLSVLNGENDSGSPAFLERFGAEADLNLTHGDNSYHLFLKTLTSAFKSLRLRALYTDKKISSLIWRFVPSHGRTYSKENAIERRDLDALRNHHDLLCVLYYVSPPGQRLKVSLLQDLVNHADSHRAACRISVRAWAYLTTFQASVAEDSGSLRPLLMWFNSVAQVTTLQFRLARLEAEEDFRKAQSEGVVHVSKSEVEAIVMANQKQMSITLVDLLAGFKSAVNKAGSTEVVQDMVQTCQYWKLFDQFDISDRNLRSLFQEGLDVVQACLVKVRRARVNKSGDGEDSQEFGDASALEELAAGLISGVSAHRRDLVDEHQQPVMQLLSNAFGAEASPDDTILTKCIEVWIDVTSLTVEARRKSWHDTIYGFTGSWHQMRDTRQRQLFTPYVLAQVITHAPTTTLPRTKILCDWLLSLVDRESSLKFQHELTAALLTRWPSEPLIYNVPFAKDSHGHYSITLADIRQRRLSTIAAVLQNVRSEYRESEVLGSTVHREARATYSGMIQSLMAAMKDNYRTISGSETDVADPNAQGSYVTFVHAVVTLLQEHITDICPIDKFFTDSAAFPLPAEDPTYVVGRLRSFSARLLEARAQKELAVFVHTTLLRGISGDKQTYLVSQFIAAVSTGSQYNRDTSRLRQFLLGALLPAYLDRCFTSEMLTDLLPPLLSTAAALLKQAVYDLPTDCQDELEHIGEMLVAVFGASQRYLATYAAGLISHSRRDLAFIGVLEVCKSGLTLAQWLMRYLHCRVDVMECLRKLDQTSKLVRAAMDQPSSSWPTSRAELVDMLDSCPEVSLSSIVASGVSDFIFKHLKDSVVHDWRQSAEHLESHAHRGKALTELDLAVESIFGGQVTATHNATSSLADLQI